MLWHIIISTKALLSFSICAYFTFSSSCLLHGCWNIERNGAPAASAIAVYHPIHACPGKLVSLLYCPGGTRMAFGQHSTFRDLFLSKHFQAQQQQTCWQNSILNRNSILPHSRELLSPLCCRESLISLCAPPSPNVFHSTLRGSECQEFQVHSSYVLNAGNSDISSLIFLKSFVNAFHSDVTCYLFYIFRCLSGNKDVFFLMREWRVFTPQLFTLLHLFQDKSLISGLGKYST